MKENELHTNKHLISPSDIRPTLSTQLTHQLPQRPPLAPLQRQVTALTNPQTAKHTPMPNLPIHLLARHTRHGTPRILGNRHIAMFLETGIVDFAEWGGDGLDVIGGCVGCLFVAGGLVEGRAATFWGGDEVF
jgi:hypothetical protein